jgi:hypothetical protein
LRDKILNPDQIGGSEGEKMKKYLVLVLGMLFILGFTASAFAVHSEIPSETQAMVAKGTTQVTMGGEIRVRGWYLNNASGTRRTTSVPMDGNTQSWYDQRVRLSLGIEASKNTSGFIMLESGTDTAFAASASDTSTWGVSGSNNSKSSANLKFLEAWILYKGTGLGIPAGLKIGHMPLALSEKQFLDHTKFGDDAIVFFMDPTKQLHVGVLTAKLSEGSTVPTGPNTTSAPTATTGATISNGNTANDINSYHALATYKVGGGTFGVNYTYIDDQGGATFANLQNIGLHASGKAGIVSYKAEYDRQFGDAPDGLDNDGGTRNLDTLNRGISSPGGGYHDRFKGYAYLLGVGVTPVPVVTIRGEYAYGSGDNVPGDGDNEAFQTTLGNDIHYTQIFEYTTTTPAGARSTGLSNVTYYRVGVDVNPMKDLSASMDIFILSANKVYGTGNDLSDGRAHEYAPLSKKIGTEYDFKVSYKLDKNLTYFVMAGYLDTGGWWLNNRQLTNPSVNGQPASANDKPITQAMHGQKRLLSVERCPRVARSSWNSV